MFIRKAKDRGHFNHGWLDTYHTFSFADYLDSQFMGYSVLRVINEDKITAGAGFATHGHKDMEIISYVIEGALEHQDSMGNSTVILPNEIQRMTAGTGIRHSEYNHSKTSTSHFLQIWIIPDKLGLTPSYEQKKIISVNPDGSTDQLQLIVSKSRKNNSVFINQDVDIYCLKSLNAGEEDYKTSNTRHLWLQMIKGEVALPASHTVTDIKLTAGDGLAITSKDNLKISWAPNSEFLLFDMP
jgi:redox-sensitive bicupin YhaK (pirin superfamily)